MEYLETESVLGFCSNLLFLSAVKTLNEKLKELLHWLKETESLIPIEENPDFNK